MPHEEPTFDWAETSDAVTVRFPAPPPERYSKGCATALLGAAAVLGLLVLVTLARRLVEDTSTDAATWVALCLVAIVATGFLLFGMSTFREAQLPARAAEPSVLSVTDRVLKIERAGPDRGMDYSWERTEIADVRICAAAPDRIRMFLSLPSLLGHALFPDEVIRVSVERRSGEVDDVFVSSPGRYWIDALETRLRAHLGLAATAGKAPLAGGGA
jgi:hypothetical protein